MHNFVYVPKEEVKPVRDEIEELLNLVQNDLREKHFTFGFEFIGSYSRNMVTRDLKSNIGFDLDVNIYPNYDEENYSAEELKNTLMESFNKFNYRFGYSNCKDSTSVITIRKTSHCLESIDHSCDFAIVYKCQDGRQQYVKFNKKQLSYYWEYRGKAFLDQDNRVKWLKKNNLWEDVRNLYLYKKNINNNPNKHSRSLFAETINELCRNNGYFNK